MQRWTTAEELFGATGITPTSDEGGAFEVDDVAGTAKNNNVLKKFGTLTGADAYVYTCFV